ncbi:MAG: SulP family inorganic anion transporter [Pseudoclavibacter sp.]
MIAQAGFGHRIRSLLPDRQDLIDARRSPGTDLLAGATVAVVALPLALAFGVASGVGAAAGMTTAIIAGIIAAVFGGSNLQVTGPTGAMTVVLLPIVHQHGVGGVLTVGLMAGVMLTVVAFARVGRYVQMLPASLLEGFTAGIAVVIALQQVPTALGVPAGQHEQVWAAAGEALMRWAAEPHWLEPLVALGTAAVILIAGRLRPGLPWPLLLVAVVTALAWWLGLPTARIGELPTGLPAPNHDFLQWDAVAGLIPSALAVAALGALESLLSASVADGMTVGEQHDPDRELFGQGLANIVVPFFGGVPATAAIARTAVNVRSGARSRTSAVTHSLILLGVVLVAGSVVAAIPLAVLAGVLLATCVNMVSLGSIRSVVRATRGDALVFFATFATTVIVDVITAVIVGFALASLVTLKAVSDATQAKPEPLDPADHSEAERDLLRQAIVPYRLEGALFFGVAQRFLIDLTEVSEVRVVILRMGHLSTVDATGAQAIGTAVRQLHDRDVVVLLSAVRPEHEQVLRSVDELDALWADGEVFATTPEAITRAKALVA